MDLRYTAAEHAFRDEVRAFVDAKLPNDIRDKVLGHRRVEKDDYVRWHRILNAHGWGAPAWPKAHGGTGWSPLQRLIFEIESFKLGAPRLLPFGLLMIGPVLMKYASPAMQARFLPRIPDMDDFWCQGYSEPGAGSDLANVRTRAARQPDGAWRIDGQKVWTSLAHDSEWIFVLARSDPQSRGNKGLSFLLVPLDQPGVEIRPIRQMNGGAEFNEVFFDGARAEAADLVGEPGDGWRIAMMLLGFERGISTLGQQMQFIRELDWVIDAAREAGVAGDPAIRARIAKAWAGLRTMRYNALRMLAGAGSASAAPDKSSLIYKYYWSNWHRDLGQLAMDVLGERANLVDANDQKRSRLQGVFLFSRADTLYAGTNEIQLNIMAERGLGMPKEPRGQA